MVGHDAPNALQTAHRALVDQLVKMPSAEDLLAQLDELETRIMELLRAMDIRRDACNSLLYNAKELRDRIARESR